MMSEKKYEVKKFHLLLEEILSHNIYEKSQ